MAKKGSTVSVVYDLARPVADELGFNLWDVRFEKEGGSWFLRIILDKPGGIDMDDCTEMSRRLDPILDEEDPVEQSYFLEVASAGLGRELRRPEHFEACLGQRVELRLIRPQNGLRDFKGILNGYQDGVAEVLCDGENLSFPVKELSFIRLDDLGEVVFEEDLESKSTLGLERSENE